MTQWTAKWTGKTRRRFISVRVKTPVGKAATLTSNPCDLAIFVKAKSSLAFTSVDVSTIVHGIRLFSLQSNTLSSIHGRESLWLFNIRLKSKFTIQSRLCKLIHYPARSDARSAIRNCTLISFTLTWLEIMTAWPFRQLMGYSYTELLRNLPNSHTLDSEESKFTFS